MHGTTGEGWLYALANDTPSNWGEIENFYSCMDFFAAEGGDPFVVESPSRGKLQSLRTLPVPGDGFAFYHSTRAGYPSQDRFGNKPRISLVGELLDIELSGQEVTRIRVAVNRAVLDAMRVRPIVRKLGTQQFFERCGIVPGAVATLYHADAPTWDVFSTMVLGRLPTRSD